MDFPNPRKRISSKSLVRCFKCFGVPRTTWKLVCAKFKGKEKREEEGRRREEKGGGGDAKRFTCHVPGRLIKFQKLKHHLLRVVQSARRRPGKVGRASCHPFQRIKHIFHQTRLPTDQPSRAKFRPVWTVASHLERPEKSLSLPLSLPPSLALSVFTNFLYLVVRISLVDHRRFNPRSDSPDRKTMRR